MAGRGKNPRGTPAQGAGRAEAAGHSPVRPAPLEPGAKRTGARGRADGSIPPRPRSCLPAATAAAAGTAAGRGGGRLDALLTLTCCSLRWLIGVACQVVFSEPWRGGGAALPRVRPELHPSAARRVASSPPRKQPPGGFSVVADRSVKKYTAHVGATRGAFAFVCVSDF